MELKNYQRKVIDDLTRYLDLMQETNDIVKAYNMFWREQNVPVGINGMQPYQNVIPNVPDLCLKVPTGGGKTFLACNAIAPIFDALPMLKMKTVVWLVPSEAILTQTLAALRNVNHPYRQAINLQFQHNVEVYTKDQLLSGQNFNITAVREQLSIMVLSYDSFRGRKELLKAKQENSALAPMAKALGAPDMPLEDTDETALMQIINQLNPLVIVDESHHARSKLSKKMLQDFNPCFILDLTATPTKESNIISYVDSIQLKKENMVKLPVVVYNRQRQSDVVFDAIDLRNNLEQKAIESKDGYIRPIVLFQAQPKGKEDSTTFAKLRKQLVDTGIPADQIAIKTADVNELKGVDLMSESCPIRYIITVNALKEGWDCPFAYILATLANRTSKIDVEQIVGRILRQPYTRPYSVKALNMSYVLTSSNDFQSTLRGIVAGLNSAGFSNRDCRVVEEQEEANTPTPVQQDFDTVPTQPADESVGFAPADHIEAVEPNNEQPEFLNFDPAAVAAALQQNEGRYSSATQDMLDMAEQQQNDFAAAMQENEESGLSDLPQEVQEKVTSFAIANEYKDEIADLRLPQFFVRVPESLFTSGMTEFLSKENLLAEFSLEGQPYKINFETTDDEIADRFHFEAWKQTAEEVGAPFDETINMKLRGVSRMESLEIILSGSSKTFTDAEKERLATEKNNRYRKLLAQMSPADMPAAVRDALTALHNAGLKLAVGSSSKNAAYILERLDANRYFDAVCDGTMIAHSKPDPEVFTKAAAMVGLAPADCLVVEDAAAGLEAARAGGMDCAIVGTAPMPFEPTYHIQDVTKLPGTIL